MPEAAQLSTTHQQWFNQGNDHLRAGRWAEAESIFRRVLMDHPNQPEVHHNLGLALKGQRKLPEACAAFVAAVKLRPVFPDAYLNLGDALQGMNRPMDAITAFRRAVELKPDMAEGWNHMGIVLRQLNRHEDAVKAYKRALAVRPDLPGVWNNMGNALRSMNLMSEAIEAYRRALAIRDDMAAVWNNLAVALKDTGQIEQAMICHDRGIALQPDFTELAGSRIYTLSFHPGYDEAAICREARKWNDGFVGPLRAERPVLDNDPDPQRRLRIGYVSPDFRGHVLSLLTTPLLARHDRSAFEIFCYSAVAAPDHVTARLRRHADTWREIASKPDADSAKLIHQDRIDILVDITLHMSGSRLGIFARRPAPIQVTWLGYPGTTGLETMDYRITDPRLDPLNPTPETPGISETPSPSRDSSSKSEIRHREMSFAGGTNQKLEIPQVGTQEPHYSERSIRLSDTFWCYDPRGMSESDNAPMPDPGPLPALSAGYVTFGCLNNFCKVSNDALTLWSRVLAALPTSKMIIMAAPGAHRERVMEKLGLSGEQRQRIEFVHYRPRVQYLETYRRIDLCLDTIPYNGHTTSLDGMWMGVPVITRVAKTIVGRAGWSQMHNLGLMELVTWSDDEFVAKALEWARNLDRLSALRASLRRRMEASPLMDGARFARNMEAAYRQMWQAWCMTRR